MKKIAMSFGTFDVFHEGHAQYLRQARELGECLVVVVARDKNVHRIKGALPINGEKRRLSGVRDSGLADEVVLGDLENRYAVIEKYRPSTICLGYDQPMLESDLRQKLIELGLSGIKIVRLKPFHPEKFKSSKILAKQAPEAD